MKTIQHIKHMGYHISGMLICSVATLYYYYQTPMMWYVCCAFIFLPSYNYLKYHITNSALRWAAYIWIWIPINVGANFIVHWLYS